jgi:hypothetical protein
MMPFRARVDPWWGSSTPLRSFSLTLVERHQCIEGVRDGEEKTPPIERQGN